MTRGVHAAALSCLIAVGCSRERERTDAGDQRAQPPSPVPAAHGPAPSASSGTAGPTAAAAPSGTDQRDEPKCSPVDIAPAKLSASWSTLLGRQVRVKCRVERMVGLTDAVIRADTESFVVMLSPGGTWDGAKSKVFTVMGSLSVRLQGGPVTLPELVLTPGCG